MHRYDKYHYRKTGVRHVPRPSPCANPRAHGERRLCHAPYIKHMANTWHTARWGFAVCRTKVTRQRRRHVRRPPPILTAARCHPTLPCAAVRHTAKSLSSPCARARGTRRITPDAVNSTPRRLSLFIAVYLENTHGEGVHRVPGKWHTANSAFAVPVAAVCGLPAATVSEDFVVCLGTRWSLDFP